MRDVLTHHYFGVDDKVLWDTLNEDFDEFEKVINEIKNSIKQWIIKINKKLTGNNIPLRYRLRVSKYRILFHIDEENIKILKVDSRGDMYK